MLRVWSVGYGLRLAYGADGCTRRLPDDPVPGVWGKCEPNEAKGRQVIPPPYLIFLSMSGASWFWAVEDDECHSIARGKSSDYLEAAGDALKAHDNARLKATEERL